MSKFFAYLIVFMLTVFICAIAKGEPFLVSDPDSSQINNFYGMELDGVDDGIQRPLTIDGAVRHNLDGLAPGEHTFQFRFGEAWTADAIEGEAPVEWGDWSAPFRLRKPDKPPSLTGNKLKLD
jgi:hypothetical protein